MPFGFRQASKRFTLAEWILFVYALLTGFWLRVFRLGNKDIWWDEAHSWWYASMPLFEGIRLGMAEWTGAVGDPLYPILLHLWMQLSGDSAFTLRYLSLIFSILSVALAARVTLESFKKPAWIATAWLGGTSAIWVFYSQEVRQYTLTPLVMLVAVLVIVRIQNSPKINLWHWAGLAAAEALALYTHSFMAFGIVGLNFWLLLMWLRSFKKPKVDSRRWFLVWAVSQIGALIAIGPALPNYLARTAAGGSVFVQLEIPLILNAIWNLLLGIPWEHATDPIPVRIIAALVLLLWFIGLAWVRITRTDADLLLVIFFTMGLVVAYWWFTPIIHPRYLLFLSGPLFIVVAVTLVRLWQRSRMFGATLVASLAFVSLFNLGNLYTGRFFGYRHDPSQAVVAATIDQSDGQISIDPFDFSLRYYGLGEPDFFAAGFDEGLNSPGALVDYLQGKREVDVIRFHAERSDVRQAIPYYLEHYGQLTEINTFESYQVFRYVLDEDPVETESAIADHVWPEMQLVGYTAGANNTVTLALDWSGNSPSRNYSTVVRIYERATNWLLAEVGKPIYDEQRAPTSEWNMPQNTTQYFNIPLPEGLPRIELDIEVTLVDSDTAQAIDLMSGPGQQVALASLSAHPVRDSHPYETLTMVDRIDVGALAGMRFDREPLPQGGQSYITVLWQETSQQLEQNDAQLLIMQDATVVGRSTDPYLTANMSPWLDRRELEISSTAQGGQADIVLQYAGEQTAIGVVEIEAFPRVFAQPSFDIPVGVQFSEALELVGLSLIVEDDGLTTVELVWAGLEGVDVQKDYAVFVHLVDAASNVIIAQHDGMPVFGQRPTTSIVGGEYLLDPHPLPVYVSQTADVALRIGLYDPQSFERVMTSSGLDAVTVSLRE